MRRSLEKHRNGWRQAFLRKRLKHPKRELLVTTTVVVLFVTSIVGCGLWLLAKATKDIRSDLLAVTELVPDLKEALVTDRPDEAYRRAQELSARTGEAREASSTPLWHLASQLPWAGANFSAITEISRAADDVAGSAVEPLLETYESVHWSDLLPGEAQNLSSIRAAAPAVAEAAQAVEASLRRLDTVNEQVIVEEIASPLSELKFQLVQLETILNQATSATQLAISMLGEDAQRDYLLIIQNNSESRATGGIPGALAVLSVNKGEITFSGQTTASSLGVFSPGIPVDPEQIAVYSGRIGKFMQDINLTPDFPTSAVVAQKMWEERTGQKVDGVISVDPVALSYILDASGPINISDPDLISLSAGKLPLELNSQNVVRILLSDVYTALEQPSLQDAYFARVAQEVFANLTDASDEKEARALLDGMAKGASEGRLLVWADRTSEQTLIARFPVGGSITGSNHASQFAVYFNDGTGAKMDYYVERTVQLVLECPKDGHMQTVVRVTSTNTAPADAAHVLPEYVTGGGIFGTPPGNVQTNVIAYGPVQSQMTSAQLDGANISFAPHMHGGRPLGVVAIQLAPGETKTIDFVFGRTVQQDDPKIFVTPTVQPVHDVVLAPVLVPCV